MLLAQLSKRCTLSRVLRGDREAAQNSEKGQRRAHRALLQSLRPSSGLNHVFLQLCSTALFCFTRLHPHLKIELWGTRSNIAQPGIRSLLKTGGWLENRRGVQAPSQLRYDQHDVAAF
jgi:hypothetical protein